MGFWSRLFGRERKSAASPAELYALLTGGSPAKSGVAVTPGTALQVSTVLACCRVLAEGVAQLPFKLYRERADGGKEPARDHPLYRLLHRRPNEWQTSFEWREMMMIHAILTGNAYAAIVRVDGRIVELIPLLPGQVAVEQAPDYTLRYRVTFADGQQSLWPRASILHLRGPSWNGYLGLDAVRLAREAIGLALTTEETHARLHSNGARPGGILTTDGVLDDTQITRIRASWEATQGGVANAMKTAILEGGLKWMPLAMSGVDAQHLETRKYQVEEVCRFLRVFPQMVGYSDKTSTYASAEQFFIAHVIHSLGPWLERVEQAVDRDLIGDEDGLFAKFSTTALLRGDNASRAEFYASGITNGWLLRNEARRFEELDPLPGLDQPLVPLNMATPEDRAVLAKAIAAEMKSDWIGHNGGPPLDDAAIEAKIGRVLSAANEHRLRDARDALDAILAQLGEQEAGPAAQPPFDEGKGGDAWRHQPRDHGRFGETPDRRGATDPRRARRVMRRAVRGRDQLDALRVRGIEHPVSLLAGEPGTLHPGKGKYVGGWGVRHLVSQRDHAGHDGNTVADRVATALARGQAKVLVNRPGDRRWRVEHQGWVAIIVEGRHAKAWLLTGYWEGGPGRRAGRKSAPAPG